MKSKELSKALACAIGAARAAGKLMYANWHKPKKINSAIQHDIKLELDERCQALITKLLRKQFPAIPILGEEGILGDPESDLRWVVDPIDGTVNFTHDIPHACVCIALQRRTDAPDNQGATFDGFETILGVILEPFCNELWTATAGGKARLNGNVIEVSDRKQLNESIVSLGFAKNRQTLGKMLPVFGVLVHKVRKIRMMGAAGLAMTYVATGRFEAYLEYGLRLWDIAAGALIIERAGGKFTCRKLKGDWTYEIVATNHHLHSGLTKKQFRRH